MSYDIINPADPPEKQIRKLTAITQALMRRMEQTADDSSAAYAQFQHAVMLEDEVRARTRDLDHALTLLNRSNAQLAEANLAAEAARQNLANAIETITDGFALFDADDVLVLCNSRFGMDMDDILGVLKPGLHFSDYIDYVSRSRFLAFKPGEDPESWAISRRKHHGDAHAVFNVRLIGDRWVQVSEHRTPDGGAVITQTDVTEIVQLERLERSKMLDEQSRMIRATLDHINQGVCVFDQRVRLAGFNQRLSTLLAIPLPQLRLGVRFDYLLSHFHRRSVFGEGMTTRALSEWARSKQDRVPLHFTLRRGDGVYLDVFAEQAPDGGFVMSFTDVTAEQAAIQALSQANETLEARVRERTLELEDALARAERASASRSRFVAAASHDLLQPLSAAKLFMSSITADMVPLRVRVTLEKAEKALVSVESILGALLDISKLEAGRAALCLGDVRLGELLSQLRDEFTPLAQAKGLTLTVMNSGAAVRSDPVYLRRILQNLISNAIRYTTTGRVLVGVRRERAGVRIEVWDTGPGIPVDERQNIFKEFHRLQVTSEQGMGLGLAIVDRACALLGHPLRLVSTLGRGTGFALSLDHAPAAAVQAPSGGQADTPVAEEGEALEKIVFLVENDDSLRFAMTLLLESWGVTVLESASGEEALALFDEIGILPDAFLVDYHLGKGMTGLEFIEILRERHGPVHAALVTANRAQELDKLCLAVGIPLMRKPLDTSKIEAFLQNVGEHRGAILAL